MGRRPIAHRKAAPAPLARMDPEVQKKVNEVGLLLLSEVKVRLEEKIKNGDMGDLSLKELLAEYNKAVKSLQGPATTITAINVPQTVQNPDNDTDRSREIRSAAIDPDKIEKMRERQERFLEEQGGDVS